MEGGDAMTAADLAAIKARADAATAGPWHWTEDGLEDANNQYVVAGNFSCEAYAGKEADAAFISAASSDVPALIAEVDRLRAALEAAKMKHRTEAIDAGPCAATCDVPDRPFCTCGADEHNAEIDRVLN